MSNLDLTVVIPAFNAEASLTQSIKSAQICGAAGVVVVDDGSTDGTAVLAESLGARVIRQENAGASVARETGLRSVATEYVVLLDADDALMESGVKRSVEALASDAGLSAAIGAVAMRRLGSLEYWSPWAEGVTYESLLERGTAPGPPGAVLWRTRSLRQAVEGEPDALHPRYAEDYELLLRGARRGRFYAHKEPSCLYETGGGKSALHPIRSNASAEALRAHYASIDNISIRKRSFRELQAMAHLRRAFFSDGRPWLKCYFTVRAGVTSPYLFGHLLMRKIRRRRA